MRFVLGFIVFFNTLLAVLIAVVFFYGYGAWTGPGPLSAPKEIIITRGTGVSVMAEQLQKEDVIKSGLIFKIAARVLGKQSSLKAGEYSFDAQITTREVLDRIARGEVIDRKVTIPEGQTSWQIVEILKAVPELSGDIKAIPEEGSLLPETYHYTRDMARTELITKMQTDMRKAINTLWPERAPDLPFTTQKEALILASIVEKETGVAAERAKIAGVFINRLRRGIPLQTDPTVIYAITKGVVKETGMGPLGRRLLKDDLVGTDSPYNTYKYPGLPPGPIANPGQAAIAAVLHPEQHDYIFFVADGSGGHLFSKTLEEHLRNAAQWRQIRKQQGN